jgi:hypothetical protein
MGFLMGSRTSPRNHLHTGCGETILNEPVLGSRYLAEWDEWRSMIPPKQTSARSMQSLWDEFEMVRARKKQIELVNERRKGIEFQRREWGERRLDAKRR